MKERGIVDFSPVPTLYSMGTTTSIRNENSDSESQGVVFTIEYNSIGRQCTLANKESNVIV